jgi:hypothetical protein
VQARLDQAGRDDPGRAAAAARLRAATCAMSFSLQSPASMPSLACNAAMATESGQSGATR